MPAVKDGKVLVEIDASRPAAARKAVARLGGTVNAYFRSLIEARVPKSGLGALSRQGSVKFRPPAARGQADDVRGEEVEASLASAVHAQGITGKGTKVAIIDGSFNGLAARQASGDLPATSSRRTSAAASSGAGRDTARPSPRSSTRWRRTRSCTWSASTTSCPWPPPRRT